MRDLILRTNDDNEIDLFRSNEVIPDNTFDDRHLDFNKLKELIENKDPSLVWLEHSLKYAIRFHESIRNAGSSDVIMMLAHEQLQELWK